MESSRRLRFCHLPVISYGKKQHHLHKLNLPDLMGQEMVMPAPSSAHISHAEVTVHL